MMERTPPAVPEGDKLCVDAPPAPSYHGTAPSANREMHHLIPLHSGRLSRWIQ